MRPSRSLLAVTAVAMVAVLAARTAEGGSTPATSSCSARVGAEVAHIASRIYGQEAHGRDVTGAVARVEHSAALAAAVGRGDRAGTRAALRPLLRADIRAIEITHRGHVLASFGAGPALGPVSGSIRNAAGVAVGRFTLATGTDAGMASLIGEITGAQVVLRAGRGTATGAGTVYTLPAEAFPSGPLRIELRVPSPPLCGTSPVAETIGAVGQRLFAAEAAGPRTRHVLDVVATDPRFVRAVADRDPAAVRAQIIRFFQDPHLHVVRIRASDASGRLINDVGGPDVLAPASRAVRWHGRTIGTVTLSVQDDTGYIKLMHRFTGADVVLRTADGVVPGSSIRAADLPERERRYHVFSFDATAFPSGTLHISLLTR